MPLDTLATGRETLLPREVIAAKYLECETLFTDHMR
jgi:hypothetical protein